MCATHPYHPRQEPSAVVLHARICARGAPGNRRPYRDRVTSSNLSSNSSRPSGSEPRQGCAELPLRRLGPRLPVLHYPGRSV